MLFLNKTQQSFPQEAEKQLTQQRKPVLHMEHVSKRFQQRVAVNDISMDINPGDIVGLLGPNGSGKTTTLRMALGLITPTHGTIELFGRQITQSVQRQEALRRVGSLIEYPIFYPYLSARDNLRVTAMLSGWAHNAQTQQQIHQVLDTIGLLKYANMPFKRYSLGMKQRLGIGAALLTHPEFLVLDEPTNGLDPQGIAEIRTLLTTLARQGTTLLISSHLLYEIQQICSRVIILKEGKLIVQGYVNELLQSKGIFYMTFPTTQIREQAHSLLEVVRIQDGTWLQRLTLLPIDATQKMASEEATLEIHAPLEQIPVVCALLAQYAIYPIELRRHEFSLEQLFFTLTSGADQAIERNSHYISV